MNMKHLLLSWPAVAGFVLASLCFAAQALAEDAPAATKAYTLDEVFVTAQKREENLQDVPESVTALSAIEIEDADIETTTDLSQHVPNFYFNDFGSRRHGLMFMRGIKSLPGIEPATGYYVDGVGFSKSYMYNFPLFDVEQIEVLRGPQGTLYGRNTMGGVINVRTKQPGNEPAASISTSLGNYSKTEVKGSVSGAFIKDKLYYGIAALYDAHDGYAQNDTDADGREGNYQDAKAARMKMRLTPSDALDLTLSLDGQTHDDGAYPFRRTSRNSLVQKGLLPTDMRFHYSHDFEGSQSNDSLGISLNADYDTGFGTFTSITGYRDYYSKEEIDADFSPLDMMRKELIIKDRPFSQELRFASPDDAGDLKWLTGAYFFHCDVENDYTNFYRSGMARSSSNPFNPGTGRRLFQAEKLNWGGALFGQATYTFFGQLDFTLGLRADYEEAEIDAELRDTPEGGSTRTTASYSDTRDFVALTPKIALDWRMTPDHMLYVSFAGAHRSGGFNDFAAPSNKMTYDSEYSWNYELGSKNTFFNKQLTLNLSGFYTAIEDEQLAVFNEENMQGYLDNAGRSHRVGAEAEARYSPLAGLELIGSCAYVEAEYDKYEDPVSNADYKGNRVSGVPDYSYTLGAQYRYPLTPDWNLFSRVDLIGTGVRYFDDANEVRANPYALVNAKLGFEGKHFDGYLWAKNLLDRRYTLYENTAAGIAQDGPPITVGVTLSLRF